MTQGGEHCSSDEATSALVQIHEMLGMEVPQILL